MTISIGGAGSQPRTEFTDLCGQGHDRPEQQDAGGNDTQSAETTTLLSGATSLAALTAMAMGTDEVRSDNIAQLPVYFQWLVRDRPEPGSGRNAERVAAAPVLLIMSTPR